MPIRQEETLADIVTCLGDEHARVWVGYGRIVEDNEVSLRSVVLKVLRPAFDTLPARDGAQQYPGASIEVVIPATYRLATHVLSASMHTQAVSSLSLDWTTHNARGEQTQLMRWMMLVVFSSQASHSIRHICFRDFAVSDAEVDDLRVFLQSVNRLGVLGEGAAPRHAEETARATREQIFLATDTIPRLDPMVTDRIPTVDWPPVRLADEWGVDVVDGAHERGFYNVLLPAYGFCRIRRRSVDRCRTIPMRQDVGRLADHGIKSLTLNWSRASQHRQRRDYQALFRFLDMIGAPLKELSISLVNTSVSFVEAVLQACPLLTTLEFASVNSDIIEHILTAYASTHCRVTRLHLDRLRREQGSQHIALLCAELSNPERQISRMLTTLSLDVGAVYGEDLTGDEVTAISTMLETNPILSSITLTATKARREQLSTLLRGTSDQHVQCPKALSGWLAFVSVVNGSSYKSVNSLFPAAITSLHWLSSSRWRTQ